MLILQIKKPEYFFPYLFFLVVLGIKLSASYALPLEPCPSPGETKFLLNYRMSCAHHTNTKQIQWLNNEI
jgi:hypothetical protein